MKKVLYLPLFAILLIAACEKENLPTETAVADQPTQMDAGHDHAAPATTPVTKVENRAPERVTVCHYSTVDGTWRLMEVPANSLPGHLAHGDVLLVDADGDGWVAAANECVPGGDCDDNNPLVNPGATEILNNGIDDDCNPDTPDDTPFTVNLPGGVTLYVHPTNNSNGIVWGGSGTDIAALDNITDFGVAAADLNGEGNTEKIVAELGAGNYAVQICADLVAYGYDDWYLPSAGELDIMYDQIGAGGTGQMPAVQYWSSTEYSSTLAWILHPNGNLVYNVSKPNSANRCRCVRK
jgi:hypothetical protein